MARRPGGRRTPASTATAAEASTTPVPPLREPFAGIDWGRALVDLAAAIEEGRPHRASGEQAAHVVEVLEADRSVRGAAAAASRFSRASRTPRRWTGRGERAGLPRAGPRQPDRRPHRLQRGVRAPARDRARVRRPCAPRRRRVRLRSRDIGDGGRAAGGRQRRARGASRAGGATSPASCGRSRTRGRPPVGLDADGVVDASRSAPGSRRARRSRLRSRSRSATLPASSSTPLELALACQEAEQAATGVPFGIMDQLASIFGRRDDALLIDCRSFEIEPMPLPAEAGVVVLDTRGPARARRTARTPSGGGVRGDRGAARGLVRFGTRRRSRSPTTRAHVTSSPRTRGRSRRPPHSRRETSEHSDRCSPRATRACATTTRCRRPSSTRSPSPRIGRRARRATHGRGLRRLRGRPDPSLRNPAHRCRGGGRLSSGDRVRPGDVCRPRSRRGRPGVAVPAGPRLTRLDSIDSRTGVVVGPGVRGRLTTLPPDLGAGGKEGALCRDCECALATTGLARDDARPLPGRWPHTHHSSTGARGSGNAAVAHHAMRSVSRKRQHQVPRFRGHQSESTAPEIEVLIARSWRVTPAQQPASRCPGRCAFARVRSSSTAEACGPSPA